MLLLVHFVVSDQNNTFLITFKRKGIYKKTLSVGREGKNGGIMELSWLFLSLLDGLTST